MSSLSPIKRPDGRMYRPQKLAAYPVSDYGDDTVGVVVFGTHDIARAQSLADEEMSRDVYPGTTAIKPRLVWWRDGFECGRRGWVTDEVKGRAGVFFQDYAEPPMTHGGGSEPLVTGHV